MSDRSLSDLQIRDFVQDGYLLLPGLFSAAETALLVRAAEGDTRLFADSLSRRDGEGGITKLRLWNEAGEDICGLVARSERIVRPMEQLLGGEVYFYHSKMTLKEPYTGGAWAWHQDYGYWYNNGCLYPAMASCMIALDPTNRENGCLQVIKGSHELGRLDHQKVGDQTGADPQRVEEVLKRLPLVYCEMSSGDALIFHGNLLHRSDQNRSPQRRWLYICCYNAARNNPYKQHHHPCYTPLNKVDDATLANYIVRHARVPAGQAAGAVVE
jgi:hypothetical protein